MNQRVQWVTPPEEIDGDPVEEIVNKYMQLFGNLQIEIKPLVNVNKVRIERHAETDTDRSNSAANVTATNIGTWNSSGRSQTSTPLFQNWRYGSSLKTTVPIDSPFNLNSNEYVLKPQQSTLKLSLLQLLADLPAESSSAKMIRTEIERMKNNIRADLGKITDVKEQINAYDFGDEL